MDLTRRSDRARLMIHVALHVHRPCGFSVEIVWSRSIV